MQLRDEGRLHLDDAAVTYLLRPDGRVRSLTVVGVVALRRLDPVE